MEKNTQEYEILRIWSEALYDHQDVRLRSLNRVRCLIRNKLLDLGYVPEKKKKDKEDDASWKDEDLLSLLESAKAKNKLLEADFNFLNDAFKLAKKESIIETEYEKKLQPLIANQEIWNTWLLYVNGIGTRNACRLLKYFGYCERFDTVSKLWTYAGVGLKDGHVIKRKKGEQLNYSIKIKSGVLGVIGDNLIKSSGKYKKLVYDTYKKRILERGCCNNPKCKGKTGHASNMAKRKMMKVFLEHYWLMTRRIKGLDVRQPYIIGKHGHTTYIEPFFDKKVEDV